MRADGRVASGAPSPPRLRPADRTRTATAHRVEGGAPRRRRNWRRSRPHRRRGMPAEKGLDVVWAISACMLSLLPVILELQSCIRRGRRGRRRGSSGGIGGRRCGLSCLFVSGSSSRAVSRARTFRRLDRILTIPAIRAIRTSRRLPRCRRPRRCRRPQRCRRRRSSCRGAAGALCLTASRSGISPTTPSR